MSVTVDYTEQKDSPEESISLDGVQVVRTLQCAREDRILLTKQLLGYVSRGIIYPPDVYIPDGNVDLAYVYAKHVSIRNIGKYEKAELTVTYQTLDYDTEGPGEGGGTTYVSESFEAASEFATYDTDKLFWGTGKTDPLEPAAAISQVVRMVDWVYTIHHMLTFPAWIFDYVGKVNLYNVRSFAYGYTFPAETLLCGNPTANRSLTSDGLTAWTVTFRFSYKNNGPIGSAYGWNHFPRPSVTDSVGNITFARVYDENDRILYAYPRVNFSGLIM